MSKKNVQKVESFAGTEASYFEDSRHVGFRIRKSGKLGLRIHLSREVVRIRPEYIALDVPIKVVKAVLKEAGV